MVTIEKYKGDRNEELINFLSNDSFMHKSNSPSDSVIASILEYQKRTGNFGKSHGSIMLNDQKEIVGFLGCLAFPASFQGKEYIAIQTTSAFVDNRYPGNFGKLVDHYIESGNNSIVFTIFPIPKIYSSFEKKGFVVVNYERFKKQYYLIVDPKQFTKEIFIHKKFIRVFSGLISILFPKNKKTVKQNKYESKLMPNFNNNYSLIEKTYKQKMFSFFTTVWNQAVLNNKFGNKILSEIKIPKENEILHFCTFNNEGNIIGSIVIKKIRNYKRFIICDIQTVNEDQEYIIKSIISEVLLFIKKIEYNSLMFFGIEERYLNIITKHFKHFKKNIDKRCYYIPNSSIPTKKVNMFFSDDDLNF